jgi:hypothetical protein
MLVLPLLLALSALVVDGANGMVQRRSIQQIADAAALAAAQDLNVTTGGSCGASCQATLNKYVSDNGFTVQGGLVDCSVRPTNCYVAPYKSHIGQIEVRLKKNVATFFGRAVGAVFRTGLLNFDVSARAVGAIANGAAPQLTFAALNSSCDSHTLVIRSSGHLTVNNIIYVNSCSGTPGHGKGDGFDIFGSAVPPGSISAKDILVHGGWETHTGLSVIIPVGGPTCPLMTATTTTPPPPTPPECPKVGQPLLVDPFAGKLLPPPLDSPAITNTSCPCWTVVPFSTPQILDDGDGSIGAMQSPILAHGSLIPNNRWISIDGERMLVTANPNSASPPKPPDGKLLTVTRGQLSTAPMAHTAPSSIPLTAEQRVGDVTTLTTASAHGLDVGEWVKVAGLADTSFNGIWKVTSIPDDETGGAKEFSYDNPGPDVGGTAITGVARDSGLSMVRTAANHGLSAGDAVVVNITSGDTTFNEDAEDGVTVDSSPPPTSTTFAYNQPSFVAADVHGPPATINSIFRFKNVAAIVTATNHNLPDGEQAVVDVPSPYTDFSGVFPASFVNNTTFTYSNSGADVTTPGGLKNVTAVSRLNNVATVTVTGPLPGAGVPALSTTFPNNVVDVGLSGTDPSFTNFNGTFPITTLTNGAKTFTYANSGPDTEGDALGVLDESRANSDKVTMTTASNPTFKKDDVVRVNLTGADTSFNGTWTVTSVGPGAKFTFTASGATVTGAGETGTVIQLGVDVTPPFSSTADHAIAVDIHTQGGTVKDFWATATGDVTGHAVDVTGQSGTTQGPLFEIFRVPGNPPSALLGSTRAAPVEYAVPASAVSPPPLAPGTYYGGVCIGAPAGAHCGPKVGGTCATSTTAPAMTVTMKPGIYIMAGGGFYVCGNTTLDATAGVMIYNTVDSAATSNLLAAELDQVMFNTNGAVNLAPVADNPPYNGMAIYQGADPAYVPGSNLALAPATKCDNRPVNSTDIALVHTGNGLDGISGTIYAPADDALFRDAVSGTATLAVITGCIFIDGATSTFNFANPPDDNPLAGIGYALTE